MIKFILGFSLAIHAAEPLNYEALIALIRQHDIRKVEDLLAKLPADFRENYTLVYDSRSQQAGTKMAPRVLMFGKDAEMVIAFNGGEGKDEKSNAVEIAQFRPKTGKVELREIHFPKTPSESVHYSGRDPVECKQCHGDQPKYILRDYNVWPGMYGSDDDSLDQVPGEKEAFDAFVATAKMHPRYRYLEKLGSGPQSAFPYYNGPVRFSEKVGEAENPHRRLENQPNTRLTIYLLRRHALRSLAKIEKSPFFRKYQDAMIYLYLKCDTSHQEKIKAALEADFKRLFPKAVRGKEDPSGSLEYLFTILGLEDNNDGLDKPGRPTMATLLGDDDGFTNHKRLLVALVSQKTGKSFAMKTFVKNAADVGSADVLKTMDALAPLEIDKNDARKSCDELGRRSVEAIESFSKSLDNPNSKGRTH